MATAAAATATSPATTSKEKKELSDVEFTKYLMNEDTCCPICYKPFLPDEQAPTEGFVKAKLLDCNHAVCEECAKECYEEKVAFVGHGVRCPFHKRDQTGHDPYTCGFVTPKKPEQLEDAKENMIIAKVLRDTGVLLGTQPKQYKDREYFYYYKFCHECQQPSTCVCKQCTLPYCEQCWKQHTSEHKDHACWTLAEYDKVKVQANKCSVCKSRAYKYCGVCKKFYCRNRKNCYDCCMDPEHLLIDFDPSIVELKRYEATAMDNVRKMFIHDMHDYLETNPFLWQASDMECLHRTMWHVAHDNAEKIKAAKDGAPVAPTASAPTASAATAAAATAPVSEAPTLDRSGNETRHNDDSDDDEPEDDDEGM